MRKSSTYQDCLRAIGHEIDQRKLRAFALEEDAEAIWVLALRKIGRKRHMRWQYRENELLQLIVGARSRRGMGRTIERHHNYENILRLIGRELDQQSCQSFALTEFDGDVSVRYSMSPSTHRPHLMAFSEDELNEMVDNSIAKRTQVSPKVSREYPIGRRYESWVVVPAEQWELDRAFGPVEDGGLCFDSSFASKYMSHGVFRRRLGALNMAQHYLGLIGTD